MGFKRPEVRILSPRHSKPSENKGSEGFSLSLNPEIKHSKRCKIALFEVQNEVHMHTEVLQGPFLELGPRPFANHKAKENRPQMGC